MGKYFSLCDIVIVSMVQQDTVVENSNATHQTDQSVRSAQVSQQKIHAAALSIHETLCAQVLAPNL